MVFWSFRIPIFMTVLIFTASNVTKFIELKLGSHIFRSCCPSRYEFTSRLTLEIHIDFGTSIARHSNFCHCNATQLLKLQLKFLHRLYQSQDSKVIRIINKPSATLVSWHIYLNKSIITFFIMTMASGNHLKRLVLQKQSTKVEQFPCG